MSTMPQSGQPQPEGMSTLAKALIGCTVGCLLLVLITCGGIGIFTWMVSKPFVEQAQKIQSAEVAGNQAKAELDKLDTDTPPRLPENVATADLSEDDVARYIRIRTELAPQLELVEAAAVSLQLPTPESLGGKPSVGSLYGAAKGLIGGLAEAQAANAALLAAAAPILAREGIGPSDLARLVEAVEWHFLQRPEALALGLPEFRRDEVLSRQMEERLLAAWSAKGVDPAWSIEPAEREKAERQLAEARARLAEMEAEARQNVALTDATRTVLEAHRAEIEALGSAAVTVLAPLSSNPAFLRALDGGHGPGITIHAPMGDPPLTPEAPSIPESPIPSATSGPTGAQ